MKEKIDFKTIINFSKGKYSYNDYLKVKNWFNQAEKNNEINNQLFEQWKELTDADNSKDESLHHIFEKVQYAILLEERKIGQKNTIWSFYRQAAAILLIPVLAFSLWYYLSSESSQTIESTQQIAESWVEINAPDGARVEFFLPDSSQGWLNSGSKLKYPTVFNKHRKVNLTGEAYFEVKHLDQSDFIVNVDDLDIKVLGTKFNVSAYSGNPCTHVVLVEGKVEINGKSDVFNHILSPNEKISFNNNLKTLNLTTVDANRFTVWKDGFLIIEDEPLGQVAGRIERWYNAEIVIQDEELKNYRFKATFKDEPLEEVLRLIALTTPINYSIEKRVADADGKMKRKKVIIKPKL
jgi:transmembrane sensor